MGADAADAVAREHLGHVEADAAVLEQRLDLIIVVDIWLRLRHPGRSPPAPRTLVPVDFAGSGAVVHVDSL